MSCTSHSPGIVFVGPGVHSQGGIATVIRNYGTTDFWREFHCELFSSTEDFRSRIARGAYGVFRIVAFALTLIFGPRPWAVSIHTAHDGSFFRKFAYALIARAARIPVVLHIHPASFADFFKRGSGVRRWAVRLAGRLSDQIIVLSVEILEELAGIFPRTKLAVLHNPVDIQAYADALNRARLSRPRILFMGWIIADKGVYDIVDAMPDVLEAHPDALFTFAGNKEIDRLRELIGRRGLSDYAEVPGWVDGTAKVELLRDSSVLVLPSYTEGVPNVILEAMASGLPIVTTPVGGIPSVLTHNETAIFVRPGDVRGLAAALNTLLADEEKCRSIAAAAFKRVCDEYSTNVIGSHLQRIYARYRPCEIEA